MLAFNMQHYTAKQITMQAPSENKKTTKPEVILSN